MRAIGSPGVGNGQFDYPSGGVAFDGEGNLVVNDGYNHQIQVFLKVKKKAERAQISHGQKSKVYKDPNEYVLVRALCLVRKDGITY